MEIDETKFKQFMEYLYIFRYSWNPNMDIEGMFQEVHKAFGKDIFKKLGIDKEA